MHGGLSYGDMGTSHGVPTLGSLGVQQPGMGLCTHMPPGPEQWSCVQGLPSSHCPSTLQQPGTAVLVHVEVARSQASSVHGSVSAQSEFCEQQPGMVPPWQKPPGVGHVAFEHLLPLV